MVTDTTLGTYLDVLSEYPVFLAYNANVDAVTGVDEDLEAALEPPSEDPPDGPIDAPGTLARLIADAMDRGDGDLVAMDDEFGHWLTDVLEAESTQLGGQAAIMADLLATMDAAPVLYTYLLTERQRELFQDPSKIRFPLVRDGGLDLRPMSEVTNAEHTKVNWIFEFEEGDRFYDATAASDSRFIAAARPERVNLETGLEGVASELGERVSCALLSGIHSLKTEYEDGTTYEDRIQRGREFVRQLKRRSDLPVQMEYGVTHKDWLREEIVEEIVPEVDAIGMDSRELDLLARDIGLTDDPVTGDIVGTYELLEDVRDELDLDGIKLHRTHYHLTVTSGDYLGPEPIRQGWEFASIVAAAKATVGSIDDVDDLAVGTEVDYSDEGLDAVADLADHVGAEVEHDALAVDRVVAHPNRVVADPDGTVGLGDSISVANFALEQALAERPEREIVQ